MLSEQMFMQNNTKEWFTANIIEQQIQFKNHNILVHCVIVPITIRISNDSNRMEAKNARYGKSWI